MTQYSRIHVLGKGANYSDRANQGRRYAAKTKWATNNPDKLVKPEDLYDVIKEREKNPQEVKVRRRRRNSRKIDANVPVRNKKRSGGGRRKNRKNAKQQH